MSGFRLTKPASRDFVGIVELSMVAYPGTGKKFMADLVQQFRRIGDHPEIGKRRDEYGEDVRSIAFGVYIVFYRVAPNRVYIARILHSKREIDSSFFDSTE
jgi:toxin ParE1/3/4